MKREQVERTILNWRWWLALPVLALTLPVVACDLALAALVTIGEVAEDLRRVLSRAFGRVFDPLARWVRKGQRVRLVPAGEG